MIRRLSRCLGIIALALLISVGAQAQQEEWASVVNRLHGAMLDVMRDPDGTGYQERYDSLAPAINESFDFPRMARTVVGKYWKTLSEADRETLIRVFRDFTIAKYATRLNGYKEAEFRLIDAAPGSHGTTMVRTELARRGEETVALTYILLDDGEGRLRIADVLLKGAYSELAKLRAEYTSVMKRKGFDGLISAVEHQTARMANGA